MRNQCCLLISEAQLHISDLQIKGPQRPPNSASPSTISIFVMPSSFKKSADLAPIKYRTPSPPRYAFEPISPIHPGIAADEERLAGTTGHRNGGFKRPFFLYNSNNINECETVYPSEGPMDAFASIALATKSNGRHRPSTSTGAQFINDQYHDTDRPSKRAKSENITLSEWSRTAAGPSAGHSNSYEQSPESRRLEAELLLNFAHEAAKLVSAPQESPQVNTQLSLSASRKSLNTSLGPTVQSPEERREGCTEGESWNLADNITRAGVQTSLLGEQVIDEKRPKSEADPRQETNLDHRISDEIASEIPHTIVDRSEIEIKRLSPAVLAQQSDLDTSTEGSGKNVGSMKTKAYDRPEVEGHTAHSGAAVTYKLQNNVEAEKQINCSGADINNESDNEISSDERCMPNDPQQELATQPMRDFLQALEDAVQESEGQDHVNGVRMKYLETFDASGEPQEETMDNESRTMHGALGNQVGVIDRKPAPEAENKNRTKPNTTEGQPRLAVATAAICASCKFGRSSQAMENDSNATSWICCDGCKSWFHFACAGFKNDREVRSVDKYRCRKCKPVYGSTTYVRKSSRAHSAIDYAGLHQGVIKTSDERPEHHYIKPIKDGTITFLPESFARMRPELVTAEYFEKGTGMREPTIIPSCFNPRPKTKGASKVAATTQPNETYSPNPMDDNDVAKDWLFPDTELEVVSDHGQDALDMVIPQGLTVRRVAELYGLDEKVEVIDVKSQNGENKKWNMKRWADYYENPNNKVVRNVISLEVSQSKLGRLIRRPQIVRDLDLQDSVWPEELLAKGEYPRVQFYCLMSVADCFTDFHIDFGGSSVFYHILKGKKTFLFIPPKEKHLKKYEEWCMSPAQNWTFLGDQTKECYRVDLSEGDTMLIPAGWIHAVWTPEDSLVIGGNFLTRLNFGMQLRVAQVEKATGVARKFRYPHFQKLHWYTALRYLEDDPLPKNVKELLHAGGTFFRQQPTHNDFDSWGENSLPGLENYHTRYYSQSELDGLPDLTRYLLRTALIDIGSIADGISVETRNAVKKSIPRGHGEPLDVLKTFAAWCAWKRGNEPIPHWAYPEAEPETLAPDKLSAAAMKKLDREAALQAPRRQSARMQSQRAASEVLPDSLGTAAPSIVRGLNDATHITTPKKSRTSSGGTNGTSHRKTACESCRKKRRACKHKDQAALSMPSAQIDFLGSVPANLGAALQKPTLSLRPDPSDGQDLTMSPISKSKSPECNDEHLAVVPETSSTARFNDASSHQLDELASHSPERAVSAFPDIEESMPATINKSLESISSNALPGRSRHKACNECRKSKVSTLFAVSHSGLIDKYVASLYTRSTWQ